MTVKDNLVKNLLKGYDNPEDLFGKDGILKDLTRRLIEEILRGELDHQLGYDKHEPSGYNSGNSRNGTFDKIVKTESGEINIEVPRDRNGEFIPLIVPKGETRLAGMDDKILSMYALGMSTADIKHHLETLYNVKVSKSLISTITDRVIDDIKAWQTRPLEQVYPIVFLDATFVKIRENGTVKNRAIYVAIGIGLDGHKDILGLWIAATEGAKFWLNVLTEIKNRGVEDIFIVSVDGLNGFTDAIEAVFPLTTIQLCIVHMIRNSMKRVPYKDKKALAADLKKVYTAVNDTQAEAELDIFEEQWKQYPVVAKAWRRKWEYVIPFFGYPEKIRKIIYTTNTVESLNACYKKITKQKKSFPSDQSALKSLYLASQTQIKKWKCPIPNWAYVYNVLAIMYEERMPQE